MSADTQGSPLMRIDREIDLAKRFETMAIVWRSDIELMREVITELSRHQSRDPWSAGLEDALRALTQDKKENEQ